MTTDHERAEFKRSELRRAQRLSGELAGMTDPTPTDRDALAEAADFLRRLQHVDRDILVWIRGVLAERDALRANGVGFVGTLDVERTKYRDLLARIVNWITTEDKQAAIAEARRALEAPTQAPVREAKGIDVERLAEMLRRWENEAEAADHDSIEDGQAFGDSALRLEEMTQLLELLERGEAAWARDLLRPIVRALEAAALATPKPGEGDGG